ncbi:hypothetical protein TNCV_3998781 [Trichonephila clavipes]|nr:hypothetical protein TNCV_3998781 [Trichonephila clavipes]
MSCEYEIVGFKRIALNALLQLNGIKPLTPEGTGMMPRRSCGMIRHIIDLELGSGVIYTTRDLFTRQVFARQSDDIWSSMDYMRIEHNYGFP